MKAHIEGNGILVVSPETELESYALKMWSEEYNKEGGNGNSILMIETIEIDEGNK